MRWDNLFDDLEAQLEHELQIDEIDLRAEDERLRLGRLTVRDRLAAIADSANSAERARVVLDLRSGEPFTIAVSTLGRDWLAGDVTGAGPQRQVLVPFSAIVSVMWNAEALAASTRSPGSTGRERLTERLGFAFALRDVCRRRAAVRVTTVHGEWFGTVDRVGRDHLDLAVHESGTYRYSRNVNHVRLITFDTVTVVTLSES